MPSTALHPIIIMKRTLTLDLMKMIMIMFILLRRKVLHVDMFFPQQEWHCMDDPGVLLC
jgi:hypothetical protein